MSSPSQSNTTLVEQFEDTVEKLLDVRTQYAKSIQECLAKTTEAKISKMRRMKFKDWETASRALALDLKDITYPDENPIIITNNIEKDSISDLQKEIEVLVKCVHKIKPEI